MTYPGDKGFIAGWHNSINTGDTPVVNIVFESTDKHCKYGGKCSVHIQMAGKELLRYEAPTEAAARDFVDGLEYTGPKLNQWKAWEICVFTDSGFQTLSLDESREPQAVLALSKDQTFNADTVTENVIHARNLAARYYMWYERRGWQNQPSVHKLAGIVEVLNTILRNPQELNALLSSLCPMYRVEKNVFDLSHRKRS